LASHTAQKTENNTEKMRTKTLLIAAASALAAAVTSSQAQTVYSANTVGYANLGLTPGGYELITPTFDLDGTGTNGTISTVVGTNVAVGTSVLAWTGSGYNTLIYESPKKGSPVAWQLLGFGADPTYPINAGQGFFISDPSDTNLTVTGNVLSGNVTNAYVLPSGTYALVGAQIPYGGDIGTNLNYTPNTGDSILTWGGNGFNTYIYESPKKGSPVAWQLLGTGAQDPVISVGQGFFLDPAANTTWVETYTNN
jgi:hypothetical protein